MPSSSAPAGQLRLHLVLAASYFGLYALLLTFMPSWAVRHGEGTGQTGALVSLLAVSALITDTATGRLVSRFGTRAIIVLGTLVLTSGVITLLSSTSYPFIAAAAALLGCSFSLLFTPILTGLASFAGPNQVWAQSINAAWQRGGALVAALFLTQASGPMSDLAVIIACACLIGTLLVAVCFAREPRGHTADVPTAGANAPVADAPLGSNASAVAGEGRSRLLSALRRSRTLRVALIPSIATPLLVIAGSSFFPLFLLATDRGHLIAISLIAREILALGTALALRRITNRRTLAGVWLAALSLGAVGFLAAGFPLPDPVLVLMFAVHGSAISAGIVAGNVLIFDGTTPQDRTYGYAAGSIVNRLTSLTLPLLLGATLALGPAVMNTAIGICCAVIALGFSLIFRRATNEQ